MWQSTLLSGIAASALAACGGAPAAGVDPVDFTGAPWTVTLITVVDCGGGQTGQVSTTGQLGFVPSPDTDEIMTISEAGCTLKLHVTGNTAVLANGPVVCTTTSNGRAFEYSFASYTATIVGPQSLTITAGETENFGGTLCKLTIAGSGTR